MYLSLQEFASNCSWGFMGALSGHIISKITNLNGYSSDMLVIIFGSLGFIRGFTGHSLLY